MEDLAELVGELVAPPAPPAAERPSPVRIACIVWVCRAVAAAGGEVPRATRRLTRRALWALGPAGWAPLWRALRALPAAPPAAPRGPW